MALETFKATAQLGENLQVETRSRGHKVIVDEPEELGGTDTGENPVELLLSALGACQSIAARTYADKFGVNIEDLRIELEGDIDLDGFLDKADVRPGFSDIRYKLHLKTDAPEDKVKQFTEFVEQHCPVGDTVANTVNLVSAGVVIENSEDTPAT
ncbi:OsmC family protein [Lentibacillus salicampi]|uniref:OsmC family peroxiredoxin n=1 Tax=Lentibacillus salicampi TaxID=175306 RepID=A0A4Y9A8F8_9BACI|nr:OsmC family protein [Lentibacillus salicampi]TFJ92109.1 OsmC family peroxiredoxin [Lentibacillus salicampi]